MIKRTCQFQPHTTHLSKREDGAMIYTSGDTLPAFAAKTGDWLDHWAEAAPDRVFLAERHGAGWREVSYREAAQKVRAIGQSLLARGMNGDTPILIISGNSVDHGLLALGAQYVGVPICPVAEQYALVAAAHGRLIHAVELIQPRMIYADNAEKYAAALALPALNGIEVVCSQTASRKDLTTFEGLLQGDTATDVDAAAALVGPQTIGKILMTSGSTSAPKGVETTQKMMCVNQVQLAQGLPFLKERPPVLVDWLPWNHVFGGSHNFNMALANGGALYIDDGKPVKGLFDKTRENLSLIAPTVSFNVPLGYTMLVEALQNDKGFQRHFFSDLDLMFYAGASLPQDVWRGLETMAMDVKGEVPLMTSSWGLTETAPAVLLQQEPIDRSGIVGVPLAGCDIKLIPNDVNRFEARIKGPNVMPGYYKDRQKTSEAFDDEGYFITGDAMSFVDPSDPNQGLKFDGRISEDFKLLSGTWVRAAQLRLDMLACLAPFAGDIVMTGADKAEIGMMIFPNTAAVEAAGHSLAATDGAVHDKGLLSAIKQRLVERANTTGGSSTRVARAIILSDPASMPEGEMTAKGNLNFRKILMRRAELLSRLYASDDACVVTV